jgi:hypothetical protein
MNLSDDSFEAELASLRPREVSPELRNRIARGLADVPTRQNLGWQIAALGGLVAACLALTFFPRNQARDTSPDAALVGTQAIPPGGSDSTGPTLLAFRRVVARSPDDLEPFLDGQGKMVFEVGPSAASIRVFTPSPATLYSFLDNEQ